MTTIQLRRGTAAEWVAANPILAPGEIGVELDTNKFKCGDGVTYWSVAEYYIPEPFPGRTERKPMRGPVPGRHIGI